ncbi:MAG: TIGR03759 family integrating conjugative element protein [Pseudomonadota bacterium]|nr:TIGR03759 family integrating conjugative element protein [Pseudomonadota bacterium]
MINALLLPFAVALAATPLSPSRADQRSSPVTQTARTETVRTDQTNLSRGDITRAQAWGLSQTEWRRYESLMEGIRGSVSPDTLSPLEVLGIHARDEPERRRYAELWAQAMWEDAERILAFQRAYVEAGRRLYPGVPLIDPSRLPVKADQTARLQPQDRALYFTRPSCAPCDALLTRLLGRIEQIAGVDIYLAGIDPGDDQAVRDWAAQHGIDPEWVRAGKVTLNFEAGALAELTGGQGEIPTLMRRRGDGPSLVSPAEF